MVTQTRILICLGCEHSFVRPPHRGVPETCPACQTTQVFRVAAPDELTAFDRSLLASVGVRYD